MILRVHRDHDVLDAVAEAERGLHQILGDLCRTRHVEPASHRDLAEDRASRRVHERGADRTIDLEDVAQDAVRVEVLARRRWDGVVLLDSRFG